VLFYQRGGYTPGAETFEDALIQTAGAKNISAERGIRHYGVLPLEALIEAQPDYVIFSEFDKLRRSVGGWLLDHPALKQSQKIQTVTIPGRWLNCGGPLSAEAVLELRKAFSKNK
jgi:iron complex transport system substrate-binding protein